jgi:hypothetical protein
MFIKSFYHSHLRFAVASAFCRSALIHRLKSSDQVRSIWIIDQVWSSSQMSEKRSENSSHWFEQTISETFENWEYDNYRDDNLWNTFLLNYEDITEEEFEVVSNDKLEELRDSLTRREVWVQKDISVARALINTLLKKALSKWSEENQSLIASVSQSAIVSINQSLITSVIQSVSASVSQLASVSVNQPTCVSVSQSSIVSVI